MECYCDYEQPSVYSAGMVTARKQHGCSECGRIIEPGERYERASGIWDDMPANYCTCAECLELRQYVQANVPCYCWAHGNMIQDARDILGNLELTASESAGLLFGAGRRLIAIRRKRERTGRAPGR